MLSLFIFVILIVNAKTYSDTDPSIIFNIQSERFNGQSVLTCDHSIDRVAHQLSTYTVYEGHEFTIVTKYNETINYILCHALNYEDVNFTPIISLKIKNVLTTYTAEKSMGTQWKCWILTHLDKAVIQPVVQYKYHNYSAVHCYMGIHVRRKVAPQTILVNNMELPAVRINLSQKDVDLIAEYQYADGDIVNVTCINKWSDKILTMEYKMAGKMSNESIMNDLSSNKMIGFVTKLHSGHDNSYMICTHREKDDYTKVMVKFVMRTNFHNIVFLKINGMILRPHLDNPTVNLYRIDYKYVSNQLIHVLCGVQRTDVKLLVLDEDFHTLGNYSKNEILVEKNKMSEMIFSLSSKDMKLECATDYLNGTSAETVAIHFTEGIFPVEKYPLHMKFARDDGREMELYNDYKLNVIFYEFYDESFFIRCGELPLLLHPGPILYLELGSTIFSKTNLSYVSKSFYITRQYENTAISCFLKEQRNTTKPGTDDIVHREIRVIFHERVLTAPTSTTTTTPAITLIAKYSKPASSRTLTYSSNNNTLLHSLSGIGAVMIVVILAVLYYSIIKKRCCVRSSPPIPAPRIDPASVFYENQLAVFKPINEREAAETDENHYEDIE